LNLFIISIYLNLRGAFIVSPSKLVAKLQLGNAVGEAPASLTQGDKSHPLL